MAEPLRHRQTKGAETDMLKPNVTAPHLDSTDSRHSIARDERPQSAPALRSHYRSAHMWYHDTAQVPAHAHISRRFAVCQRLEATRERCHNGGRDVGLRQASGRATMRSDEKSASCTASSSRPSPRTE